MCYIKTCVPGNHAHAAYTLALLALIAGDRLAVLQALRPSCVHSVVFYAAAQTILVAHD